MKAYSQDLRDRVISLYNTGEFSKRAIAKLLKLAYHTVRTSARLMKLDKNRDIMGV